MTLRNCITVIILLMSSIHITYAAQRVYVPSTEDDIYGTPQILQKCFVGFQDGNKGDVCYLMQMVKTSNTYSRLTQQKVTLHHGTLVDTLFSGTRHRIARNWQYKNSINLTCLDYLPGNGSNQQHQWSWIPTSGSQIMYVPFGENNPTVVYTNTDSLGHYEMYNNTLEGYKYIVFNDRSVGVRTGGTPTGQFDQVNQFAEHLPIETPNTNFSALTVFVPGWLYTDTFRLGTHGTWADGFRQDSLIYVSSCAHSSIAFPTPVAAEGYDFAGWRSTTTGIIYQSSDKTTSCQDEVFEAVFTNDTTPLPTPPAVPSADTTRYAEGTEFYFAFLKGGKDISNVAGEGERDNYIRVLCRQQTQITLTAPDGTSQTYTIPANSYLEINHLLHWQDKAYRLESSIPVVVEACNHQDLLQDVYTLSPASSVGTSYVVQTFKSSLAEVAIIATEDNTKLTITKGKETQQYAIRKGGLSLNQGEVCYIQSLDVDYSDMGKGTNYGALSGTRIEANHPIVVIEGCAATPYQGYPLDKEYGASDHQCSQAYSAEWMGNEFIVLGDESRGTNFAEFTTLTPNTQITTSSQVVTIQPGEVFRMAVTHRQVSYIQSSQPVSCVLFLCGMPNLDGDPSQVRIYPLSHASDYSQFTCNRISLPNSLGTKDIATLPIHVLHLVCPTSQLNTMHLDGQPFVGWKPVPNRPDWSYIITTIPKDSLLHHLANTQGIFTGYMSALTTTESYAAHLPKMRYWQVADTTYDTICAGESYRWREQTYSEAGMYKYSNKNDYGIDSVSVLDLFVKDCSCDTTYSTTYKQIEEADLPTFQWNGMTVPQVPQSETRDTTLVFPTMKLDASCDSIATLHLHILEPCEVPSSYLPIYWHRIK